MHAPRLQPACWVAVRPPVEAQPSSVDADPWLPWLQWAARWTPHVARWQDAVVLELSGSLRLWGGRDRLLPAVLQSMGDPPRAHCGWGASLFEAYARAGRPDCTDLPASALPVAVLPAAQAQASVLEALGCSTWGDLDRLPRAAAMRRLGTELLRQLDQALGRAPQVLPWWQPALRFEQALELPQPVSAAPQLLWAVQRLLQPLQEWLLAHQRAVASLRLQWQVSARHAPADAAAAGWTLHLAQPRQRCCELLPLLQERLQRTPLPQPVQGLRLVCADTVDLASGTADLWHSAPPPGADWLGLIDRLSQRLGVQQVAVLQPVDDHRPECMQVWQPATAAFGTLKNRASDPQFARAVNAECSKMPAAARLWHWPTWLWPRPQRLPALEGLPAPPGAWRVCFGPHRLEAGWWGLPSALQDADAPGATPPPVRDYWGVIQPDGGFWWLFCTRQADGRIVWYRHGCFA